MFRAMCAYHQEVKIVLYSIWYRHTLLVAARCAGWDRTAVHRLIEDCSPLSTCAPDGHLQSVTIPDAVQNNSDLLMMSTLCSKHVQAYSKLIIKQEFVH